MTDYSQRRQDMVRTQLKARDIVDPLVLKAMKEVPRHEFVPLELKDIAYADNPLPIGDEQTISQPYIVALMTQALALKATDKVLEIGAGSGYQAAVLSRIAKTVYTVERVRELAEHAETVLRKLCYMNIHIIIADGTLGLEKHAPYDAIIVSAACFKVPDALIEQLKEGGNLVIPIGDRYSQKLMKYTKTDEGVIDEALCDCAFVPLIGEDGWKA